MSGSDAYEGEMHIFSRLGDRVQDSVLAGRTAAVDDELQELAAFCSETRALYVQAPPEATAAKHLAEIADEARLVASGGAPASDTPGSGSPARRRSWIPLSSRRARVALTATGLALLATFGGGAYAGVLPGPMQDRVADVARNVGLSLPRTGNDRPHGGTSDTGDGGKDSRLEPAQRTTHTGVEQSGGESEQSGGESEQSGGESGQGNPDEDANLGEPGKSTPDQGAQESGGGPEQSSPGDGGQANGGETDQSGGDQAPQSKTREPAQGNNNVPEQPSDPGQGAQSDGSDPTQDGKSAGGGEPSVSDPESQVATGTESG